MNCNTPLSDLRATLLFDLYWSTPRLQSASRLSSHLHLSLCRLCDKLRQISATQSLLLLPAWSLFILGASHYFFGLQAATKYSSSFGAFCSADIESLSLMCQEFFSAPRRKSEAHLAIISSQQSLPCSNESSHTSIQASFPTLCTYHRFHFSSKTNVLFLRLLHSSFVLVYSLSANFPSLLPNIFEFCFLPNVYLLFSPFAYILLYPYFKQNPLNSAQFTQ